MSYADYFIDDIFIHDISKLQHLKLPDIYVCIFPQNKFKRNPLRTQGRVQI